MTESCRMDWIFSRQGLNGCKGTGQARYRINKKQHRQNRGDQGVWDGSGSTNPV